MKQPTTASAALVRVGAMVLALAPGGCRESGTHDLDRTASPDERPAPLETVGEFAVAPLYADGFQALSPRERALAYYLYRAALAGRDIFYDQMGRENLEVRDLLEEIVTHSDNIPSSVTAPLWDYLKRFWINNGNHNARTMRKFIPTLSFEELRAAARQAARDGATVRLAIGETLDRKLERLRRAIFDRDFEPLLTCRNPPAGQDILSCSSVNFYEGVSVASLSDYEDRHPLNARLVRHGDHLVEEVYRAGRGATPAGRYAKELLTITGFLGKARAFADDAQGAALGQLADYFALGDPEMFRRHNIAWVQQDPAVDTINGFIETCRDPRSRKGSWEGAVYLVDRRATRLNEQLAGQAQYFEDRAPWDDRYRRQGFNLPVARAVSLLVGVGDAGPMPPRGINLPNDESLVERFGTKSLSLVNVIEAGHRALHARIVGEFALPEDRPLLERHGLEITLLQTAMHEVFGHASGKVRDDLGAAPRDLLREHYAALEEARAELVALHHFFDPRLLEIGALSSPEVAKAACLEFLLHDISMLRRVRVGDHLEDDHMRATHLIVGYLRHVAGAVEVVRRDGKTYFRIGDLAAWRRGVAGLLARVQRIKGEGDFAAAGMLLERHANHVDPALRDEVVARAAAARIPSYLAFVMPDVVPVRDGSGAVRDARLAYPPDLATQMLRYSGKIPLESGSRGAIAR